MGRFDDIYHECYGFALLIPRLVTDGGLSSAISQWPDSVVLYIDLNQAIIYPKFTDSFVQTWAALVFFIAHTFSVSRSYCSCPGSTKLAFSKFVCGRVRLSWKYSLLFTRFPPVHVKVYNPRKCSTTLPKRLLDADGSIEVSLHSLLLSSLSNRITLPTNTLTF